ncbi:MAG: DUF5666 domain-containing protein [Actinomycetota bacterium]|nr:DUF5666 domain-containing protein [Actinomycetota bacterium]
MTTDPPPLTPAADPQGPSAGRPPGSGDRRTRRHVGRLYVVPALAVLALVAAACSSHTTTSTPSSAPAAAHHGTSGHRSSGIVGTITTVSASSLVIDVHGTTRTLALTPATTYRQGRQRVAASDLASGERVRVRTTANSTAKVVLLLPATATGTVVSLQAGGFTLHTSKGATLTVTTTSSTTYREGTHTVTAPAFQPGEKLHIHGQPGPNGTFTATKVTIVPTAGSAG